MTPPAAPAPGAAVLFPPTSWTLLAQARGRSPAAQEAVAELAERYYRPVYAYLQAIVRNAETAEELTQGFFATKFLTGALVARASRSEGRFRHYLKQALRNYVKDAWRQAERQKRRPPERELRPDEDSAGWDRLIPEHAPAADAAFHAAWVRALLGDALERVRRICDERGQLAHFELFVARYVNEAGGWRVLGQRFGLQEKTARSRAETILRHFRFVLREMLRQEVGSEQDVDEEIAALLALL